jgi:hypothetical protein
MPKDAVFTLKLEPELRDAFIAEADAVHRPASQLGRGRSDGEVEAGFAARRADLRRAGKV